MERTMRKLLSIILTILLFVSLSFAQTQDKKSVNKKTKMEQKETSSSVIDEKKSSDDESCGTSKKVKSEKKSECCSVKEDKEKQK